MGPHSPMLEAPIHVNFTCLSLCWAVKIYHITKMLRWHASAPSRCTRGDRGDDKGWLPEGALWTRT